MRTRELYETAASFALELERLTDRHGIGRERFAVRARRCDDPTVEPAADVYRVGVRLLGFVPDGDAPAIVAGIHHRWLAANWRITDYRELGNGGLAIGGTDPDTGEEHSWDTGFAVAPGNHLVGSFATGCYRDPNGPVAFGEIALSRLRPQAVDDLRGPNREPD